MSIDPYLEQQYDNRSAVPEHPEFLKTWKTRSEKYQQINGEYLNIAYGSRPRETLDIFPAKNKNAPIHIFIHGGYWQALDKNSFSFIAEAFNAKGETAIIVNYDLCPNVTVANIVEQIQAAILWICSNDTPIELNTRDIQISGHSAGGHIVAELLCVDWTLLGLNFSPFSRATPISGLFDLNPLLSTSVNIALGLDKEKAELSSPILKKPNLSQPCELRLLVGDAESDSYKEQSENMALHWRKNGLKVEVDFATDKNHFSVLQDFLDHYYVPLAVSR